MLALRLDLRRHGGEVSVVEHLGPGADRDPPRRHGEPHRPGEVAEVRVELAAVVAGADQLPGLVRRDEQGAPQLVQELGEALRVDAPQRRVRRGRPLGAARRGRRAGEQLARALGELLGARHELAELLRHLPGFIGARDRELVAQRAERPRDVLGGLDRDELADPLELPLRIVEQRLEVGDAPALGRQGLEVVEQGARQPDPLLGDDLRQRAAGELSPAGDQRQGPRRALPIGQLRIRHAPAVLPDAQHGGDRLGRIAVDVDELAVRGDSREERDTERVPGLPVDPAQAGGVDAGAVSGAVDQGPLEPPAEILDGPRLDVRGREPVAVPLTVLRLELEDRVKHRSGRTEEPWRPGEGAEERRPSRARRRDDEYGPLDHRGSLAFDSPRRG